MSKTIIVQRSSGIAGPLLLMLIFLKLTGFVTWSWWWVTAPIWAPAAIAVAFLVVACILALIAVIVDAL